METVLGILQQIHPDVDFAQENALIDDGVLDSLDIVTLVSELCEAFDVVIPAQMLLPDHFNSAAAIWEMIQMLDGGEI
ncbi:MAG: acyl carrier protein [Clostridia bacterium]|nr:acyl carrier protein [Clostridia bacterium]